MHIMFVVYACEWWTKHLAIFECAEVVKYAVNPQYLWVADKNWKIELNWMSNKPKAEQPSNR